MTTINKEQLTIREEQLTNGLRVVFTDESNRYFGDYHRICVVATIGFNLQDLPTESPDDEIFRNQAIESLGEQLSVVKRFERMGVESADVEKVRTTLIDDFLQHTATYLSRPDYPRSLVKAEMNKSRTRRFYA